MSIFVSGNPAFHGISGTFIPSLAGVTLLSAAFANGGYGNAAILANGNGNGNGYHLSAAVPPLLLAAVSLRYSAAVTLLLLSPLVQ